MKEIIEKNILSVLILFLATSGIAQDSIQNYVVVTYERERSKGDHGVEVFYWMVNLSELDWDRTKLYPLYLNDFSKNQLNNCINGSETLIFSVTSKDNYDFDTSYKNQIDKLIKIIKDGRRKVQTNKKILKGGLKETITIYLTPVSGSFCSSLMFEKDADMMGMSNQYLYMPVHSFNVYSAFWESDIKDHPFFNDLTLKRVSTYPNQ